MLCLVDLQQVLIKYIPEILQNRIENISAIRMRSDAIIYCTFQKLQSSNRTLYSDLKHD